MLVLVWHENIIQTLAHSIGLSFSHVAALSSMTTPTSYFFERLNCPGMPICSPQHEYVAHTLAQHWLVFLSCSICIIVINKNFDLFYL